MAFPTRTTSTDPQPIAAMIKTFMAEIKSKAMILQNLITTNSLTRMRWNDDLEEITAKREALVDLFTRPRVMTYFQDTENRSLAADRGAANAALIRLRDAQIVILDLADPKLSAVTGIYDRDLLLTWPAGREVDKAEVVAALQDIIDAIE